jgi:hypothetical protein
VKQNPRLSAADGRRRIICVVTDTETPASNSAAGAMSELKLCFSEGSDAGSTIIRLVADVQVVLRVWMLIRITLFRSKGLLGET